MAKNKLTLEQIRQKMADERAQEEQRAAEMEMTREKISNLEKQIDNAVENDNLKEVEKLEDQQSREKNHLATLERFNARKLDPERYKSELMEICAEKTAEFQQLADRAADEVIKAQKAILEKKAAFVKVLNDAAKFRIDCGSLAGVGALETGSQLDDFAAVEFDNLLTEIGQYEHRQTLEIEPEFYIMRNDARNYLRFKPVQNT